MLTELVLLSKKPRFENPLCAQVDPELFFPDEDEDGRPIPSNNYTYAEAKGVCSRCSHINECASWAIRNEPLGFWGGLSPLQRREARKRFNIKLQNPY
jgi:hypothetical protein